MTRKLDYYAWHAFDYAADTSHLTREEDYAYRRIIDEIFRTAQDTCRIRDDDDYLRAVARATPEEWPGIRRALIDGAKPLLRKRGGWISQSRLTEEIRLAQMKSKTAKKAVDERERIKRSSDDHRTIIGRSSDDHLTKTETKREKKRSSPDGELLRDSAVESALAEIGISILKHKGGARLQDSWLRKVPAAVLAERISNSRDGILAADRKLAYVNGIVNNLVREGAHGAVYTGNFGPRIPVRDSSLTVGADGREEAELRKLDELRDWIVLTRRSVSSWKSRGEKPDEWPVSEMTPDEWVDYMAFCDGTARSIDEWKSSKGAA